MEEALPKILEIAIDKLKEMDIADREEWLNLDEDTAICHSHFNLGMWIRNNWSLWGSSDLKSFFLSKDVFHPDDMSTILLTSYHRKANGKPIELEKQIERCIKFHKIIKKEV